MRVMKFGGTSVGSAKGIRATCRVVKSALRAKPIVVVSALAGATDELLSLAREKKAGLRLRRIDALRQKHRAILAKLDLPSDLLDTILFELELLGKKKLTSHKKTIDAYLSFGERCSARIVAACLRSMGLPAQSFDAWEIGMITDENFGSAEPLPTATRAIKRKIKKISGVPVVTGFIGKTRRGEITTFGRGGSDYTAAIIGAAIQAEVIQIWKEVDGILSSDPRIVPNAKIVRELAFEEASELAYFGAKVLHPKTILPAMKAGVPVQVLNTFKPSGRGTTIVNNYATRRIKSRTVEALTLKRNITALHVLSPEFFDGSGLMAKIFDVFSKHKTSIDVVTTSVASISLTFDNEEHLRPIMKELARFGEIAIERKKAIVCAVGGSINTANIAGRMFTVLDKNKIPVELISQASSGYSITFVVDMKDAERALKVLHKTFIR